MPWVIVGAVAGATTLVLLLLAGRYGLHRDEPYYLIGGRHPAAGYVDHPPLTPLLARAITAVVGTSPTGFRVLPSLLAGWAVLACGLVARELGGRRWAIVTASVSGALLAAIRGPHLLLGTTSTDQAIWAALLLLAVRLLRTRDPRWWLPLGLVAGVGLENKSTAALAVGAVVVGCLLDRDARRLVTTRHAAAGAALMVVLWAPHLWWQATNGVPALAFARAVADDEGGAAHAPVLLLELAALWSFVGLAVAAWGARWLVCDPEARRWRPLAIGAAAAAVVVVVAGGKSYYPAPFAILLAPAACVAAERSSRRGARRTLVALIVVAGVVAAPFTLPLLPEDRLDLIGDVNPEMAEMVGWDDLGRAVDDAVASLTPGEQATAVVLTGNYGEAGALILRSTADDPPVVSGHNSFATWGPPPDGALPVVVMGIGREHLGWCTDLERVGTVTTTSGVDNEEAGGPVHVCRAMSRAWSDLWPDLTHID